MNVSIGRGMLEWVAKFLFASLLFLWFSLSGYGQDGYWQNFLSERGFSHPIEGLYLAKDVMFDEFIHPKHGHPEKILWDEESEYVLFKRKDEEVFYLQDVGEGAPRGEFVATALPGVFRGELEVQVGKIQDHSYKKFDVNLIYEAEKKTIYFSYDEEKESETLGGIYKFRREVSAFRLFPVNDLNRSHQNDFEWTSNGSGILFNDEGYFVTNYHVIAESNFIEVEVGGYTTSNVELILVDKVNDLAILKVGDGIGKQLGAPPFAFRFKRSEVGTNIYAFGYPYALGAMGKEVKVTDGIISALTGFDGNVTTYQISAPVQGGNSGGPIVNAAGDIIGIVSSGMDKGITDNVGYAIKSSYVRNLIESIQHEVPLPQGSLRDLKRTAQINQISKFVVLVKVR